ncbi:20667_t:CDS:2 [Entrophospora sp. SA101]|nr:2631_t:CDS:2 [Entrophospora sp. SA101]CAJ0754103.1 334_t:CDS:2 [Entrophospora sp. SA101]CAJ0762644.1 20667_t:CDS:2 [Entrophospora sp. SA101]
MCRGGRPSSDVWQYFEKNTSKSKGHYTAKCRYCLKFWRRGIPDKLEAHLALKCEKVDREISQIYLKKLATKNSVSDVESEDKMSINVAALMSNQGFFYDVRIISQIFKPIKQIIHCLERRSANLSDCFLGFVYLALAIKQLPNNMNLQSEIIKIFNSRFNSFEIDLYLLAYFLHPKHKGYAMKQGNFRRICDIAVSYVSRLGFTDIAVSQLIMQMRSFKDDIEKTMFYVPKKNNDIDFSSVANSETVIDGLDLEEEESFTSLELEEDLSDVSDNNIDNNNLSIESIIDLSVLISGSDISAQDITSDITSPFAEGITDYNPHELVANLVTEDE